MKGGVVFLFDPVRELLVEPVQRREVEIPHEELVADAAEEPFDFAFRGGMVTSDLSGIHSMSFTFRRN